jgi:hypothetical protein
MTDEYKPGISPKDKSFFMNKDSENEIKELTKKEVNNNIEVLKAENKEIKNKMNSTLNVAAEDDYHFARENMRELLGDGQNAIAELADLARQSQHPRAYEVLSLMLKTMLEGNKQLMEISSLKKEIEHTEDEPVQTVNNNLFVGSTTELDKFIKQLKEK